MSESISCRSRSILLVEDEYIVAADLAQSLEDLGLRVIGPAGSVTQALELIERNGKDIGAAVLDVNLRSERVYPVAAALKEIGVPFLFTTGYDSEVIQGSFSDAPRCEKPVDGSAILGWLNGIHVSEK